EVTASAGGTVLKIYVLEGQTVPAGTVLAVIGEPGEEVAESAPPGSADAHAQHAESMAEQVAEQTPQMEPAQPAAPAMARRGGERDTARAAPLGMPHLTPVVARMAAEHDIDVLQVRGSGR